MTEQNIADLKGGGLRLYLFGEVRYADIFGESHYTRFCQWLEPTLSELTVCNAFNDAK